MYFSRFFIALKLNMFLKVGNIVPHTFVPPPFFLGARIVKEKKGYNFPYGGKIRTKILIFGSFWGCNVFENPGLQIVPQNFLMGYNLCHVWGYNL